MIILDLKRDPTFHFAAQIHDYNIGKKSPFTKIAFFRFSDLFSSVPVDNILLWNISIEF